jgi:CDGSH-type Zn-finger protein
LREELIFLLNEAAELEHSLACSYLFTAFSLKQGQPDGLTAAAATQVARWRHELIGVSIEEMYHLAVVNNLLTAVGASPHFDRPNFPHDCAYYLPNYQIELRPFSIETLDHFLAVEQPDGSNVPALIDPERLQRFAGDLENEIGPDPHRFDSQGDVYAAVLNCLRDMVQRHGESNVFIGHRQNQAVAQFLAGGGYKLTTDLRSTEQAIERIVMQGEGANPRSADSHFARFAVIRQECLSLMAADPGFDAALPVLANPFVRTPPESSGPVNIITDEFAVQVSDLFNESYGAMLQLLGRLFVSFEETDEEAQRLAGGAVDMMAQVVDPLGNLLCRLPAGPSHPGLVSGPSFVLRTVHALPEKPSAWFVLRERLHELSEYALRLAQAPAATDLLTRVSASLQQVADSLALDRGGREAPSEESMTTIPMTASRSAGARPAGVRIEVTRNGPYLVHGEAPLLEVAPVHTFNGEPVDWHTLREIPARSSPVRLCRCGHSANKPFCDLSHTRVAFDGTETADATPYQERAEVTQNQDLAIADDKVLCFSAGFCGTRTTNVWQLLTEIDDPARRELMRDMIWRCPSGRLVLLQQGEAVEPDLPPSIAILPGGPIWVRGGIPVESADGRTWEERNRVTLCRCGLSGNKPYCDGTHMSAHFDER